MTIECNAIYKTATLSLFRNVIVFRSNDYDLSTVAFKCIIKTEPFFSRRVERSGTECQTYTPPLPHLHLVFAVFFPRMTVICTLHISIAVALTRTDLRFVREKHISWYNPSRVLLQFCAFQRYTQ